MDQQKQRCDECFYHNSIETRLVALEGEMKEVRNSLVVVAKDAAVSDEQIKMIFKMLTDIKTDVGKIFNKIDELEDKPAKRWDTVVTVSLTATLTALATLLVTRLLGG